MSDLLTMSTDELTRAEVMQRLKDRTLTRLEVAARLNLCVRQVKRLWRAYQQGGPKALISRKRGRPGNRRLPPELRARALTLIQSHYADFGPTLVEELKSVFANFPGESEVLLEMQTRAGMRRLRFGRDYRVAPSHGLRAEIDSLLGPQALAA